MTLDVTGGPAVLMGTRHYIFMNIMQYLKTGIAFIILLKKVCLFEDIKTKNITFEHQTSS